jgi:hypothetical protein
MPQKNTFFITDIVENIIFIVSTSPNSNHVIARVNGVLDSVSVELFSDTRHEHVRRDVVTSFHIDISSIEIKFKARTITDKIRLLN